MTIFNARISRKRYSSIFLANICVGILTIIVIILFYSSVLVIFIGIIILIVSEIIEVVVTIQRFHDLNKSGSMFLIALIPVAGMIFEGELFSIEGTNGSNKYGPKPKI